MRSSNRWISLFVLLYRVKFSEEAELGAGCEVDEECYVRNGRCYQGVCSCLPFYAEFNSTICLTSTMLGFECVVREQCSKKVANSGCRGGICTCETGFVQFRRHTCLPGAKIGHVCYSDAHCKLSDESSYCNFTIQNLLGRCACNPPLKHSKTTGTCREPLTSTEMPTTASAIAATTNKEILPVVALKSNQKGNKKPTRRPPPGTKQKKKPKPKPGPHNKQQPSRNKTPAQLVSSILNGTLSGLRFPTAPNLTKQQIEQWSKHSETANSIKNIPVGEVARVSLGYDCQSNEECARADPNSRCINGVCDCSGMSRLQNACSAKNRGCHKGTFQCKSTGTCISWFFVCDGRKDCPDGSDEHCKKMTDDFRCPDVTFPCAGHQQCISQANRCDGTPDCPGGEDEAQCKSDKNKGCPPPHTFQCADGKCLPEYEFCNAVVTCKDGSDEPEDACKASKQGNSTIPTDKDMKVCPFRCGNGRCRSTAVVCSGRDGCGDNTDEAKCKVCQCGAVSHKMRLFGY